MAAAGAGHQRGSLRVLRPPDRDTSVLARKTPRRLLRTFCSDGLVPWAEMSADPAVMEFIGGPISREVSDAIAASAQASFLASGGGTFAVERRLDGRLLGMCGLSYEVWYRQALEVGLRLRPDCWGQGYATEAGQAWLGYAFVRLRADRVISIADVPNIRSRAVMQRLAMRFDHAATLNADGDTAEAAIHVICRDEWASHPRQQEA